MSKPTVEETRAMLERARKGRPSGSLSEASIADSLLFWCEPLLARVDELEAALAAARELAEPVVGTARE